MKHFHSVWEIVAWQHKRRQSYKAEDFERLIFLLMGKYQKIFREHEVDFMVVNMSNAKLSLVEKFCKELNISYFDLSEIVMQASKIAQLQFPIDRHYNDIYHRIVGEHVSDYLKKKYNLLYKDGYTSKY